MSTSCSNSTPISGYLGIDNGTQGISVIFCSEDLEILATGEASFDMIPDLAEGCFEQATADWDAALVKSMNQIHSQLSGIKVLGIGISGQMHGQVSWTRMEWPWRP